MHAVIAERSRVFELAGTVSIKALVEKRNHFHWSLRIQRWIWSQDTLLGVQSQRWIREGSEIAFFLGHLGTVFDGPSACSSSNSKI